MPDTCRGLGLVLKGCSRLFPLSLSCSLLTCVPPLFPESFKIQYLQFLAYTKTPQYKASLQELLGQEKVGPGPLGIPPSRTEAGRSCSWASVPCGRGPGAQA